MDLAADQMMVEHRFGIERAAEHDVAHGEEVIEDLVVFGLERKPGETHRSHQRPVPESQGRRIDVTGIGKPVARVGFFLVPGCRSEPILHSQSFRPQGA